MINVLTVGISLHPNEEGVFKVKNDNLCSSNCFGNDFVIADVGEHPKTLYGTQLERETIEVQNRWSMDLKKWLEEGKTVLVFARPFKEYYLTNNYAWLPTNANWRQIYDAGRSDYPGSIVASNPSIRIFLEGQKYQVRAHIKDPLVVPFNPLIEVSTGIYSSVELDIGSGKILLVPPLQNFSAIFDLLKMLHSGPEGVWKVKQSQAANKLLREAIKREEKSKEERIRAEGKSKEIGGKLQELIDNDLFAKKAIAVHEKAFASKNLDPRDLYEIIETVERAFGSEYEMRGQLGISKKSVGEVMKRANSFRHANKEAQDPKPLSEEEIKDFKTTVENIISRYIQFLFDRSLKDKASDSTQ